MPKLEKSTIRTFLRLGIDPTSLIAALRSEDDGSSDDEAGSEGCGSGGTRLIESRTSGSSSDSGDAPIADNAEMPHHFVSSLS